MYFGEAHTVLDDKGRLTLPRRFRETMNVFGDVLWYMTRGYDRCIFLFPQREWEVIRQRAKQYASMDAHAVDVRRMFFGSLAEGQPDRQGRMLIPSHLRDHADLQKEAVLIGVDDHLELWSRDRWNEFQQAKEEEFKNMASDLFINKGENSPDERQAE